MNSQRIIRRLGLSVSTASLAILTACGGGGSEPVASSAPQEVIPAASVSLCGVTPTTQQGPEAFNLMANQPVQINGFDSLITLLTSPTGYSYAGVDVKMSVPMKDLRGVTQYGYPEAETTDSMGVEMGSRFAPGAVGCITGVSRVANVNGVNLVSWASQQLPEVPVERLSASAVNGFEFTHNFASTEATAVFRIHKSAMVDPASATICHIGSTSSVDCATPDVRESTDGQQWELRLPITAPGVYMLSAQQEPLV